MILASCALRQAQLCTWALEGAALAPRHVIGEREREREGPGGAETEPVSDLCWNHTNVVVVSCGARGAVRLYNEEENALLQVLTSAQPARGAGAVGEAEHVHSVAFSAKSRYLCAGGTAGVVQVWDFKKDARVVRVLEGHSAPIRKVTYDPSDELIYSGGDTGDILAHRVRSSELVSTLRHSDAGQGAGGRLTALQFSPAKRSTSLLASAYADGSVCLWDVATERVLHCFDRVHGECEASDVACSPVNRLLMASCGRDGTAVFFDTKERKRVKTLHIGAPVASLSFQQTGSVVALGDETGVITVFDLRKMAAPLCAHDAHAPDPVKRILFQAPPRAKRQLAATRSASSSVSATTASVASPPATHPTPAQSKPAAEVASKLSRAADDGRSQLAGIQPSPLPVAAEHASTVISEAPAAAAANLEQVNIDSGPPASPITAESTVGEQHTPATADVVATSAPAATHASTADDSARWAVATPDRVSPPRQPDYSLRASSAGTAARNTSVAPSSPPPSLQPAPISERQPLPESESQPAVIPHGSPSPRRAPSPSFSSRTPSRTASAARVGPTLLKAAAATAATTVEPATTAGATESHESSIALRRIVESVVTEKVNALRYDIHRDMQNLGLEIVRQFGIQQTEMTTALEDSFESQLHSLVQEVQRLRAENDKLRRLYASWPS